RFLTDVGELAVAVVVEKMARAWFEKTRHAIVTTAHSFIGAENVQRLFVHHKTRDKEIEFAIIVIIKPNSAGGPAGRRHSGFIGHIGERAIAVIVIKNIPAITGDVKINPTVAI